MSLLNKILLGLLAVQIGLFALVRGKSTTPSIAKAKPLLAGMGADTITRIRIHGPSVKGTDAKADIDLVKRDGRWLLASHHDYPAKSDEVETLLGKLAAMQSRGPLTTSADRHAQLKVAANAYEGKVVLEGGKASRTIWIGTSPKFRKLSVRIDESNEIHAVSEITADDVQTSLMEWVDNVYLELDPAKIVAVSIDNKIGSLALERNADGTWSQVTGDAKAAPKPIELDQQKVKNLVKKLERIELNKIVAAKAEPAHGFGKPQARVTVGIQGTADKPGAPAPQREVTIIEIGADRGGNYLLRALDRSHVVAVGQGNFSELLEVTAKKLEKTEPAKGDNKGKAAPTPGPPIKLPPGLKLPR